MMTMGSSISAVAMLNNTTFVPIKWPATAMPVGATDGRLELVSCRLERFRKRLRSSRKRPDQNQGGLQNHLRDINGLAQNPIGYRYTIPHRTC
jgi:hypothetical protein